MGSIFGSENYITGYGNRVPDGVNEQVGISWSNQDQFTTFPAISGENRVALFAVSDDLRIAAGEAFSGSLGFSGCPPRWTCILRSTTTPRDSGSGTLSEAAGSTISQSRTGSS